MDVISVLHGGDHQISTFVSCKKKVYIFIIVFEELKFIRPICQDNLSTLFGSGGHSSTCSFPNKYQYLEQSHGGFLKLYLSGLLKAYGFVWGFT